MTKILFDALSLDGRPSGTRSRLVRLVPELTRRGHQVTVVHRRQLDAEAKLTMRSASLVEIAPAASPGPLGRLAMQRLVYRRLLASVSPQWVSAETWPMPPADGLVPVIHDLRYLDLGFPFRTLFERWLREGCARAARIHTDSAMVAGQLVDRFDIDRRRIDVVPIGVLMPDLALLREAARPIDAPYVVVVGREEPRKGFSLIREVAARLTDYGITVVRVGRRPHDPVSWGYRGGDKTEDGNLHQEGPRPRGPVSYRGIVSDGARDVLYYNAVAVLVASKLEGYSLVPLEGLAAGAWVVVSDIASHREILGDAATFFAVGDADAALSRILEAARASRMERSDRVERGRSRAARFSPAHSADAFEQSLSAAEGHGSADHT